MATNESVNAIFRAEDRASGPIEEIADESEHAAASLDLMQVAGDGAERTLAALGRTASEIAARVGAATASVTALGAAAGLTQDEVEDLDDELADLDPSMLAVDAGAAVPSDPEDLNTTVRASVDEGSLAAAESALDSVARTRSATFETDAETPVIGDVADSEASVQAAVDEESLAAAESALDSVARTRTTEFDAEAEMPDVGDVSDAATIRAAVDESSVVAAESTLDAAARTRTAEFEFVGDAEPPETNDIPDLTRTVAGSVDEASMGEASGATDDLGGEQTTAHAADTDVPSFAAAEGMAQDLTDEQIVDYRARAGEASFASAHQRADSLPDTESLLYGAAVDAASFTEAQAAMPDEGNREVAFEAAIDQASFAAVQSTAENVLRSEDVSVEATTDDGALARTKARIASAFGRETVSVEADVDKSSFAAARAVIESGLGDTTDAADAYTDSAAGATDASDDLSDSFGRAGDSSDRFRASLFGLRGGLTSVLAVAAPLGTALAGMVPAMGAVGVGATATSGALAGLFGLGLQSRAEEYVGTLQEVDGELQRITDSSEGMQALLGGYQDRAMGILGGLQGPQTTSFSTGVIESGLATLESTVATVQPRMDELFATSDRIGDAFAANRPEFFAELGRSVDTTLPMLENFAVWFLETGPRALRWFRTTGAETIGVFADLGGAALSAVVELAELGSTVWSITGPALTTLLDTGTQLLDTFNDLPGPVKRAGVVAAGAAWGAWMLAGALAGVEVSAISLSAVLGAISWPIVAIGAVAGAAYLAADHFNLFDDAVNVLTSDLARAVVGFAAAAGAATALASIGGATTALTTLSGVVAGSLTPALYGMASAAWASLGPYGLIAGAVAGLISYFGWWDDILGVVGGTLGWIADKLDIVHQAMGGLGEGLKQEVEKSLEALPEEKRKQLKEDLEESGFVDPSKYEGGSGGGSGTPPRGRGSGGPATPPGPTPPPTPDGPGAGGAYAAPAGGGGDTYVTNEYNYNDQRSGGGNAARTRRLIRQEFNRMRGQSRASQGTGY